MDDIELPPECPICEGPGAELGGLGQRRWFRCRACGWDFDEVSHGRGVTDAKDPAP